jgi:hypothetical protein
VALRVQASHTGSAGKVVYTATTAMPRKEEQKPGLRGQ